MSSPVMSPVATVTPPVKPSMGVDRVKTQFPGEGVEDADFGRGSGGRSGRDQSGGAADVFKIVEADAPISLNHPHHI